MKVGIVTLQHGDNFGGLLQCLALQNTIKGLGHRSEVIDFDPYGPVSQPWWRGWRLGHGNLRQNLPRRFVQLRHEQRARNAFAHFRRQHLQRSRRVTSDAEFADLAREYDALISGSDQVWNLNYVRDRAFFLDAGSEFQGRRISYAACAGRNGACSEGWVSDSLRRIDCLSVRNPFTADWVEGMIGRRPPVVADPTMLYDFPELNETPPPLSEPYLFVYFLSEEMEGGNAAAVRRIRDILGDMPAIVAIATTHKFKLVRWADRELYELDPLEWLRWLRNAAFVFSDSFHAILLAAKFERPFLGYFAEAERSYRLLDICRRLSLGERVVSSCNSAFDRALETGIEWSKVRIRWEEHVSQSLEFLRNALTLVPDELVR